MSDNSAQTGVPMSGRAMAAAYLALPREIYVLCAGTFVNRAGTFVIPFLAIYLSRSLGYEASFATFAIGVYGAAGAVSAVLGGVLADRIGRRTVMVISLVGGAAVLVVFTQLTTRAQILIGVAAFALIADMYRPAASAMMSDLVPSAFRPRAFSLLYVSVNLGFAVGAFVGGHIAEISFRWLFLGDAATSFIFAVIILTMLPETLSKKRVEATATPQQHDGHKEAVLHMLRNRPFVALCMSNFLLALVFHQAESTVPLHLANLGIRPDQYGMIMAVNGVMIVLLQLPMTFVLGRRSRGGVLATGALICGVGFAATGFFTTPVAFAGTVAIWTLGEILHAVFHAPVISDLSPEHLRGRYFGAITGSFAIAMMLGPPLGGLIFERSPATLWLTCLIVAGASALLLLPFRRAFDAPSPAQ